MWDKSAEYISVPLNKCGDVNYKMLLQPWNKLSSHLGKAAKQYVVFVTTLATVIVHTVVCVVAHFTLSHLLQNVATWNKNTFGQKK